MRRWLTLIALLSLLAACTLAIPQNTSPKRETLAAATTQAEATARAAELKAKEEAAVQAEYAIYEVILRDWAPRHRVSATIPLVIASETTLNKYRADPYKAFERAAMELPGFTPELKADFLARYQRPLSLQPLLDRLGAGYNLISPQALDVVVRDPKCDQKFTLQANLVTFSRAGFNRKRDAAVVAWSLSNRRYCCCLLRPSKEGPICSCHYDAPTRYEYFTLQKEQGVWTIQGTLLTDWGDSQGWVQY